MESHRRVLTIFTKAMKEAVKNGMTMETNDIVVGRTYFLQRTDSSISKRRLNTSYAETATLNEEARIEAEIAEQVEIHSPNAGSVGGGADNPGCNSHIIY